VEQFETWGVTVALKRNAKLRKIIGEATAVEIHTTNDAHEVTVEIVGLPLIWVWNVDDQMQMENTLFGRQDLTRQKV